MSKTIDERVVSMQFDNKKFEANVSTTMNTLDKLKQKLKMDGASKGLENVEKSIKKFDASAITKGMEKAQASFSTWEMVAFSAINRIVNKAIDAGERLVKSLSVDQISAGWEKYGQKTTSVQTIMNATGKTIDEVNGYLEKLMWFSDETSYGFTDMTQALGQFTSAGADIDNVIPMLMGIANATAFAGKTTSDFSRVLYNLNQSYSGGFLNYMDWKSVELAGVASKELKQALIDAGIELGTLTKDGKTANGELVTIANLGRTLNQQWANTAVMEKAFGRFGSFTEEVYKLVEDGKVETASEGIARLSGKFDDLSEKAFKSAQEAKTFEEAIDATKDAVSSGWMKTFDLIFGNYEQAKVMWTDLANGLWDFFASSAETRNEVLEEALTSPWDKFMKQMNKVGITSDKFVEKMKDISKRGAAIDYVIAQNGGSLEKAIKSGELSYSLMLKTFDAFKNSAEEANIVLEDVFVGLSQGATGNAVLEMQTALKELGYDLGEFGDNLDGLDGKFGSATKNALAAFQEANELEVTGFVDDATLDKLKELTSTAYDLSSVDETLLDQLTEMSGREKIIEGFANILRAVVKIVDQFKAAWHDLLYDGLSDDEVFERQVSGVNKFADSFMRLTSYLIMNDDNADKLKKTIRGLYSALDIVRMVIGGGVNVVFTVLKRLLQLTNINLLDATATIGDAIYAFRNWIKEHDIITQAVVKLTDVIFNLIIEVANLVEKLLEIPVVANAIQFAFETLSNIIDGIVEYFIGGGVAISEFIDRCMMLDGFTWENFKIATKDFFVNVVGYFLDFGGLTTALIEKIKYMVTTVDEYLSEHFHFYVAFKTMITSIFNKIIDVLDDFNISWLFAIAGAGGIFAIFKTFGSISKIGITVVKGLKALFEGLGELLNTLKTFVKQLKKLVASVVIRNFAVSMLMLAAALWVLAKIPAKDLYIRTGILAGLMVLMVGVFAATALCAKKLKLEHIGKLTALYSALAFSLIQLGIALMIMKMIHKEDIIKGTVVMGLMTVFMAAITAITTKFGKNMKSVDNIGKMARKLAASILLLAIAFKIAGLLNKNDLLKGIVVLGVFTVFIGVLSAISLLAFNAQKVGVMAISVAGSLFLLTLTFKLIGLLNKEDIIKGTVVLGSFAVFLGILSALSLLAFNAQKAALLAIAVGGSMFLLAVTFHIIGLLDQAAINKGISVLATFMTFLAILSASTAIAKEADKVGKMLVPLGVTLLLLTASFVVISQLDASQVLKGCLGIMVILSSLAAIVKATEKAKPRKMIGLFIGLTLVIAAIVSFMYVASKLNAGKILIAAFALKLALSLVKDLLISTSNINSGIKHVPRTLMLLGAIAGLIALLAGAIFLLGQLKAENALASSAALSTVLLALVAVFKMLSMTKKPVDLALKSIGKVMLLVGGLVLILALLTKFNVMPAVDEAAGLLIFATSMVAIALAVKIAGTISKASIPGIIALGAFIVALGALGALVDQIPGIADGLAYLGEMLGEALGRFVGGIIDGALDVATQSLPDVGTRLSDFMNNLQGFISGVRDMQGVDFTPMGEFANMLLKLTAAELLDALAGFIGHKDLGSFGTQLTTFGQNMKDFSDYMVNNPVDEEAITNVSKMGSMLAELNNSIPASGGLLQKLGGEKDLGKWSGNLKDFAKGIKEYADEMKDGLPSNLGSITETTKSVGLMLAEINKAIPASGGLLQQLGGEKDLGKWSGNLKDFAKGIKGFANSIKGFTVDQTTLDTVQTTSEMLIAINKSIPASGGWLQTFTGEHDFSKFSEDIELFADGIKSFATTTNGITRYKSSMETAASMGQTLANMANAIPTTGGLVGLFLGDKDFGSFAEDVGTFGDGISNFATNTSNIEEDGALFAIEVAEALVDAFNKDGAMKFLDNVQQYLGNFSFDENMSKFGKGIAGYSTAIQGINTENTISATKNFGEACKYFVDYYDDMSKLFSTMALADIPDISDNMALLGQAIAAYVEPFDGLDVSSAALAADLITSLTTISAEISALKFEDNITNSFLAIGQGIYTIGSYFSLFSSMAKDLNYTSMDACFLRINTALGIVGRIDEVGQVETYSSLSALGAGLVAFAKSTLDMPEVNENATALVSLLGYGDGTIPENSLLGTLLAFSTITNVKNNLTLLGEGLNSFATNIANISPDDVAKQIECLSKMTEVWDADVITMLDDINIDGGIPDMSSDMTNLGKNIAAFANAMNEAIVMDNPDMLVETIQAMQTALGLILLEEILSKDSTGKVTSFIDNFKSLATGLKDFKSQIDNEKLDSSDFKDKVTDIKNITEELASATVSMSEASAISIISGFISSEDVANQTTKPTVEAMLKVFEDNLVNFENAGQNMFDNFKDGFLGEEATSSMNSDVSDMINNDGYGLIFSKYEAFKNAGANIISGVIEGVQSKYDAFRSAMNTLAANGIAELLIVWEIHSPSRVARRIAGYFGDGLVRGLNDSNLGVTQAIANIGNTANSTLTSIASALEQSIQEDIGDGITITPVLDLSNVQNGVSQMHTMFNGFGEISTISRAEGANFMMNSSRRSSINDMIDAFQTYAEHSSEVSSNTYNINGITYDDGTNIANAVQTLITAARIERRA